MGTTLRADGVGLPSVPVGEDGGFYVQGEGIPQAWVGRDLILCRTGTETWELVTLREINELGLAYAYKSGEVGGETVFVPWTSVSWMRPPIPGDLESSQS